MNILKNNAGENYVCISPVRATFTDTLDCNVMTASIVSDNLTDFCIISYSLINNTNDTFITLFSGKCSITGDDYINWTGDNAYIYDYIAKIINITIL
jgi:hypothetical protein